MVHRPAQKGHAIIPTLVAFLALSSALSAQTPSETIDMSWDVLPPMVVRDAYGRYVTMKYFAFSIAIQNDTSNTLVVKSFDLLAEGNDQLLSVDFNTVRASILKGQLTGRRNKGIRALKGTGATSAALNGFFKNAASAATYGRIVSAFAGPVVTAIEAVIPDTTVSYLEAWDTSEVFKQGFVVEQGKSVNGIIFVPIQRLYPEYIEPSRKEAAAFDPKEVKRRVLQVRPHGYAIQSANVLAIPSSLNMRR